MKKIRIQPNGDWFCPCCGELNNTEKPDTTVQCSWCGKEAEAKIPKGRKAK